MHFTLRLLEGLVKQNNRCAGCGSEVEKSKTLLINMFGF